MPSASDEDQEWARREFGSIDDGPIVDWLGQRGFVLDVGFTWTKPDRDITRKELRAVQFLCDEWDYGGWTNANQSKRS